ncbi:SRPBCC family protein [Thermoactinospora rubra]|uniref:SRPBCC family protein n=1 Tax=Thermoactinospora rubra TaxID=1088767 RepID=UPI000A0FEB7A|nr:SRPBCC family protein [Thermoactinospora rubra]
MSTIEHSVDVNVPIRTAYNQWTQFETFPEFMEGVESVKQLTDTRTAWVAEIAGVRREFEAEITEQHPDERVAWRTLDRPHHAGVVTFHRVGDDTTRVTLQMEYDPEGFVEQAGDWLQLVRMRVRGDLERFKNFIESRGGETGAWRGDVPGPHQKGSTYGTGTEPMPPGTIGGDDLPPSPDLPPPGPGPVRPQEPPTPPRPML